MKNLASVLFAAVVISQMGATDCGQITRDPGFDLWCDQSLCAWKVERGDIARVPTWNEGDPGVSLLGSDTAIEQLTPVTDADTTCIEFDLIANIADDAQVFLNVDVDGDGTLEQMEQLPTASWKPLTFLISVKPPYGGIRFELAKRGTGEAVLAQISAKVADDASQCNALAQLDASPVADGAPCDTGSDCANGFCTQPPFEDLGAWYAHACSSCGSDADCGSGELCAPADPTSPVGSTSFACRAAASRGLGELCGSDAECKSGPCVGGVCSTCDVACTGGETCAQAWSHPGLLGATLDGPFECDPGERARQTGEPCAQDADCSSNQCNGTIRAECDDGRPCANNADCPFESQADGSLQNGACATVGVQGGTCL